MTGDREFIRQAVARADSLGLHHEVKDVREEFGKNVIDYFCSEYLAGRTPGPCTVCNPAIKWRYLYDSAKANGIGRIATGHYFRTESRNGNIFIRQARDKSKDQSYYLWMLPQEILSVALTPMGEVIKSNIPNPSGTARPRESMGVCFLRGGNYSDLLSRSHPDHPSCHPGPVIDRCGKPLGRHDGTAFYTIGQKKGLDLPPGYAVTGIDAPGNRLIAGPAEELFADTIILAKYRLFPGWEELASELRLVIRGYGVNPEGTCTVKEAGGQLTVRLQKPAWAPAAGQPAVLYSGELAVGGGFISGYY